MTLIAKSENLKFKNLVQRLRKTFEIWKFRPWRLSQNMSKYRLWRLCRRFPIQNILQKYFLCDRETGHTHPSDRGAPRLKNKIIVAYFCPSFDGIYSFTSRSSTAWYICSSVIPLSVLFFCAWISILVFSTFPAHGTAIVNLSRTLLDWFFIIENKMHAPFIWEHPENRNLESVWRPPAKHRSKLNLHCLTLLSALFALREIRIFQTRCFIKST